MSADCIFCKVVRGETPAHWVYEDEHTLAFLDIHPLTEGHTLVISKVHYEALEETPAEEIARLFLAVQRVSGALRRAFGAPATTIGINNGRAAGQVVPHLHVHILPRYPGDGGGTIHSILHRPPQRNLEEVREQIAAALTS